VRGLEQNRTATYSFNMSRGRRRCECLQHSREMTSVDVSRAGRIKRSCAQIPKENCCEADTVNSTILEGTVVTLRTIRFKNSTFCPHSVCVWFAWISEQPLFPYTKKSEGSFPSTAPRCPRGHCYLGGFQDSPVCPSNSNR